MTRRSIHDESHLRIRPVGYEARQAWVSSDDADCFFKLLPGALRAAGKLLFPQDRFAALIHDNPASLSCRIVNTDHRYCVVRPLDLTQNLNWIIRTLPATRRAGCMIRGLRMQRREIDDQQAEAQKKREGRNSMIRVLHTLQSD